MIISLSKLIRIPGRQIRINPIADRDPPAIVCFDTHKPLYTFWKRTVFTFATISGLYCSGIVFAFMIFLRRSSGYGLHSIRFGTVSGTNRSVQWKTFGSTGIVCRETIPYTALHISLSFQVPVRSAPVIRQRYFPPVRSSPPGCISPCPTDPHPAAAPYSPVQQGIPCIRAGMCSCFPCLLSGRQTLPGNP